MAWIRAGRYWNGAYFEIIGSEIPFTGSIHCPRCGRYLGEFLVRDDQDAANAEQTPHTCFIGVVGQGFVGKPLADVLVTRGYTPVRYALEEPYRSNRELIGMCDVVFIAVPTPTTPAGQDISAVIAALKLCKAGATAIIKSTVLPGTTDMLQASFEHLLVLHWPEFLRERLAAQDTAFPKRNILGVPKGRQVPPDQLQRVLELLPDSPYQRILPAIDAEFVKYIGNTFLATKVIFMNLVYDVVERYGASWTDIADAVSHDDRIGSSHMTPVMDDGRGAGGACFIKDFAAFSELFLGDDFLDQQDVWDALAHFNLSLLAASNKDQHIVAQVYGDVDE